MRCQQCAVLLHLHADIRLLFTPVLCSVHCVEVTCPVDSIVIDCQQRRIQDQCPSPFLPFEIFGLMTYKTDYLWSFLAEFSSLQWKLQCSPQTPDLLLQPPLPYCEISVSATVQIVTNWYYHIHARECRSSQGIYCQESDLLGQDNHVCCLDNFMVPLGY